MKIVGGRHRGRPLIAPAGETTRPTAGRVREAVFNILTHGIDWPGFDGASVLDVFAGSGANGFEALSRGAARATFIDSAGAALATIRRNAARLGEAERVTVLQLNAAQLERPPAAAGALASIAFLDAPYGLGLTAPTLAGLTAHGWLAAGGLAVAEIGAREALVAPPGFSIADDRSWGAARVVFCRWIAMPQ